MERGVLPNSLEGAKLSNSLRERQGWGGKGEEYVFIYIVGDMWGTGILGS